VPLSRYCSRSYSWRYQTELKSKRFLAVPIPLPSLKEQQRILAHIESLAAQVNDAERLREEADIEAEALVAEKLHHCLQTLKTGTHTILGI